jgi:hypothetical protein
MMRDELLEVMMREVATWAIEYASEEIQRYGVIVPVIFLLDARPRCEYWVLDPALMDDRDEKAAVAATLRMIIPLKRIRAVVMVTDTVVWDLPEDRKREAILVSVQSPQWSEHWHQWYRRDADGKCQLGERDRQATDWKNIYDIFGPLFPAPVMTEQVH